MAKKSCFAIANKHQENIDDVWKSVYIEILNEIREFGHRKSHYRHSASRRLYNVIVTSLCCSTVCAPCLCWDCMGCCCSLVMKDNSCRWGCAFESIANTCSETFADNRKEKLKNIDKKKIQKDTFVDICNMYVNAFHDELNQKTTLGAKHANIIRDELLNMIRKYAPGYRYAFLKDSTNIEEMREIITKIQYQADTDIIF